MYLSSKIHITPELNTQKPDISTTFQAQLIHTVGTHKVFDINPVVIPWQDYRCNSIKVLPHVTLNDVSYRLKHPIVYAYSFHFKTFAVLNTFPEL